LARTAVQESCCCRTAIAVDGLDAEVKAVEEFEELSEDIADGVASDELAHRQRVPLVASPRVGVAYA